MASWQIVLFLALRNHGHLWCWTTLTIGFSMPTMHCCLPPDSMTINKSLARNRWQSREDIECSNATSPPASYTQKIPHTCTIHTLWNGPLLILLSSDTAGSSSTASQRRVETASCHLVLNPALLSLVSHHLRSTLPPTRPSLLIRIFCEFCPRSQPAARSAWVSWSRLCVGWVRLRSPLPSSSCWARPH